VCERRWRPVQTAGLYAPGGSAPLFSTLLMLAIPVRVAGVPEIVFTTPPNREGEAEPIMIAAAALCGLDAIWLLGGAQAIAAMTYGAGMAKADKLFGPGNAYVAEAKRLAAAMAGGPRIDTPAGPSELMVIADESARPDFVAADLLSQAEHDSDAQVVLVSTSRAYIDRAFAEVDKQLAGLPRRAIAAQSLEHARCVVVGDLATAAEVANFYAPEHLSLQVSDAAGLSHAISNAGAVFVGAWSAETFGDYVCGPSHVLPTDGAARSWSGVSVASFMKCVNVQTLSREGAIGLRDAAARLARLEGLEAHARAADIRGA
jgi:histidinol dehydrogenase